MQEYILIGAGFLAFLLALVYGRYATIYQKTVQRKIENNRAVLGEPDTTPIYYEKISVPPEPSVEPTITPKNVSKSQMELVENEQPH